MVYCRGRAFTHFGYPLNSIRMYIITRAMYFEKNRLEQRRRFLPQCVSTESLKMK